MVKYFCDKCGKEITVTHRFEYKFKTYDSTGLCGYQSAKKYIEICDECLDKLTKIIEEKKDDTNS